MAKPKPYKYKGILAKPIGSNHWLIAALAKTAERREEAGQIETRKIAERVEALCDDFSIPRNDPNVWQRLALALADVTGMAFLAVVALAGFGVFFGLLAAAFAPLGAG